MLTMLRLVEKAIHLWERLSRANRGKDRQTPENEIILALRTEISELEITTGSLVGSFREVKPRAVETMKNLEKGR